MKKLSLLSLVGVSLLLTANGWAAQGSMVMRGGVGFIFPDHNSFLNMGQTAMGKGTGIEASGQMQTNSVTATPSLSYANGRFGFGVYGSRSGTTLTDANVVDSIGGGIGFGIVKEKLNLGITADRVLSASRTNDATVGAQLNWSVKKMGPVISLGFDTSLNQVGGDIRIGTAGVGFHLSPMVKFETFAGFLNLSNFSNWTGNAAINYASNMFYFGARYTYVALGSSSVIMARVGFVIGKVDLSAFTTYTFGTGSSNPPFGASLRVTF